MSDETFVTRKMEDQAEAEAFVEAIECRIDELLDMRHALWVSAFRGDFTIPLGTDCAAFEARIKAITDDIEGMLDGYAPGTREAA